MVKVDGKYYFIYTGHGGGEQAAAAVLYTDAGADSISFEADGSVIMDVEKYDPHFDRGGTV